MHFDRISLAHFKNYRQLDVTFDKKVNLIYGANGSGKTNLLDALYYFSWAKSYFSVPDKGVVKEGEDWMRLVADIRDDDAKDHELIIKYKPPSQKSIEINQSKLQRASEIVGEYPVVLIAPNDIKLVYDGSKERRDMVDRIISQCDREYLEHLIRYNRYHQQKHAHLKSKGHIDPLLLEGYNEHLIHHGLEIHRRRGEFVEEFFPWVEANYRSIATHDEDTSWSYQSDYSTDDIAAEYQRLLPQEIAARRTLIGVHRDDIIYTIRDLPLKKYGSQGQIKSYLYALRLAEYQYLHDHLSKKPVLILDDFFEKLDRNRLEQLIVLINSDTFDQIFLSDTELDRSRSIFDKNEIDFAAYRVEDGVVTKTH